MSSPLPAIANMQPSSRFWQRPVIPDVLQIPPEQVAPMVRGGILTHLDPMFATDKSLDTRAWLPGALAAVRYQGITFGVPGYVVNYTYAYNKDIFARRGLQAPGPDEWVTWDQMRETGKKATSDANGDGQPEVWGFFNGNGYTELLPLIFQAAGHVFDERLRLKIDTPPVYDGVEWLLALSKEGIHGGSRTGFYQGNVATMRLGSWEMENVINAKTPVGVASGMQYRTKGEVAYVTSFAMTTRPKQQNAAWRYLKWLTSKESQSFVAARGRVPMRRDVTLPKGRVEVLTGFINSVGTAQSYPYHVHSDYIQRAFNEGMAPVWTFQVTPKAAIPEVQRTINAYLDE